MDLRSGTVRSPAACYSADTVISEHDSSSVTRVHALISAFSGRHYHASPPLASLVSSGSLKSGMAASSGGRSLRLQSSQACIVSRPPVVHDTSGGATTARRAPHIPARPHTLEPSRATCKPQQQRAQEDRTRARVASSSSRATWTSWRAPRAPLHRHCRRPHARRRSLL